MTNILKERLDKGPVICAEGFLFEIERRGYMYPRLSISNKKPSAQITGPLSNLSLSIFVIFISKLFGEEEL